MDTAPQVPYYSVWVNALRSGLYAVHAWVCLILVILVYRVPSKVVRAEGRIEGSGV